MLTQQTNSKLMKKRPLYSEEIREILKRAVINKELKPGERVVETRWAKQLGVSQAPVREAIRELEVMGLIEIIPYQGAYVREINKTDIIEAYEVRMSLEILAVKYAVKKMTKLQLAELLSLLNEMKVAANLKDLNQFIEKDSLFQQRIVEVSGNKLLVQLWEQCKIREFTRISTTVSHADMDQLANRHDIIFTALEKKDEKTLIEEMEQHFKLLIDELKESPANQDM